MFETLGSTIIQLCPYIKKQSKLVASLHYVDDASVGNTGFGH